MPVLKVRCPECDASIRETIQSVNEPTDFPLTCPKCNYEFTATAKPEASPPKNEKKKPLKASRRRDDNDDDDDDDTPRRRERNNREEKGGSHVPLLIGAVVGGLFLLIGGIVAAVLAFGDSKDTDTVKADPPSVQKPSPQVPGGGSNSGSDTGSRPPAGPGNTSTIGPKPDPVQPPGPGNTSTIGPTADPIQPTGPASTGPTTGPNSTSPIGPVPSGPSVTPNSTPGTTTGPKPKKEPDDHLRLPPPPKLRLHAPDSSVAGTIESEEKMRPNVPLAPDEDPFVRASTFRADGALPKLPVLPPANQRPILALDSGGHSGFIRNVFIVPAMSKLTDQGFAVLKNSNVPESVLTKLNSLKNKDFPKADLLVEINKVLSTDEMKQFKTLIISNATTAVGERVITVAEDKAVRIWDIKSGTTINTVRLPAGQGDEGALQAAALSPKGNRLAVGGIALKTAKVNAFPIFIINVETGALIKTINTAHNEVQSLHYSNDGERLAAGFLNGTVQVFNANSGAQTGRSDPPNINPIMEVRFNPNPASKSQVLAILYANSNLRIVDLGNPSRATTLSVSDLKPYTIAWSNEGKYLAVGGATGDIRIYDYAGGTPARNIAKHMQKGLPVAINQIQFLAGDRELVYGGTNSWAGVIDRDTGKLKAEFTSHSNTVDAVCCSVDGKTIATSGGNQHETYVWDAANGNIIARLSGAGKGIWGIGWSKDGKSLAWGTKNMIDDVEGNCPLEEIFRLDDLGPGGPAFQTKFQQAQSTDETYTAKRVTLVNVHSGAKKRAILIRVGKKEPYAYELPGGEPIYSVCVLPGRGKVAIGGAQSLYLLDPLTKELKTFVGTSGHTYSIAPSPDGKFFVTGSSDQTIRIWQPEVEEQLMSIFIAGRDWIAWTPQGYYACSPHGERLLAWQINNTAYKMPQVLPASRFRASLYQPAIIKYLLPAGTVQYAMAMAQKYDKVLLQTTSVADILPPEATIDVGLAEDQIVDQDSFTVKASAKGTGKQLITAMRLIVDGRPFQGTKGIKRFDVPLETAETSWDVPLTPGPHTFAVIAETAVSKGMTKTVTITRKGDVPRPNLYVLAMGISDYPGDMKLKFAASDARLLANAFQTKCKGVFANIEVRILTDKDATKKGIQGGLDWLASKMTAKDVGIVSYSGHGTRDPDNKFYLVTYDIDKRDPFRTCFAGDEFKSRLDNMPGRLVAILDACHSGDVAERVRPPVSSDSLAQDLASEDSGVVVMCASLGREYSYESPISKAGYFTLGLVEGLEGHADVDEDGTIYINELDMYAFARVRQLSHGQQNSTTSLPPGIRPFPLATVTKAP